MTRSARNRFEFGVIVAAAVCLFAAICLTMFWPYSVWQASPTSIPPPLDIRGRERSVYSPNIRVNLTPTPARELRIQIDASYRFRPLGAQRVLANGSRLKATLVTATENGIRVGADHYAVSRLEIDVSKPPAIWIDSRQYRGSIRLYRQEGGTLIAVNVVPLEDYIASVVNGEMPATFPVAARRAQAIVARTYALDQMRASRGSPFFDVYNTSRSQQYLGFQYLDKTGRRLAGESQNSRRIAGETAGMVCTYQRKLFRTYYSAVCGGRTTAGRAVFSDAAEPLKSVACQWCRDADKYRWTRLISKSESSTTIRRYFAAKSVLFGELTTISRLPSNERGRVPDFEVSDGRRTYRLSAAVLRRNISSNLLPSADFTVRDAGNRFVFDGRGHGHGVGLCQWGARGLGLQGKNCIEILEYYYPGSKIVVLRQ